MPDQPSQTDPTASQTPSAGDKPAVSPKEEKTQPGPSSMPAATPSPMKKDDLATAGPAQPATPPASPTMPSASTPAKPPAEKTTPPASEPPVAPEPKEELETSSPSTSELSTNPSDSSSPAPLEEKPAEEMPSDKRNAKMFTIGLILTLAVLGSVGGLFYFKNSQTVEEETVLGETEENVEEETVATPTPGALTREEISLEILNGSGVAGAAGDAAKEFEELGYQIAEIGNADVTEGNELYVNPEVEGLIDQLLEDVEEMLDITSVSGELTDSDASARIILGE